MKNKKFQVCCPSINGSWKTVEETNMYNAVKAFCVEIDSEEIYFPEQDSVVVLVKDDNGVIHDYEVVAEYDISYSLYEGDQSET